ncbi:bifunctional lysylphosphatidylglycerol flippase/synthetase MprF [Tropicimonas sp. IMCC34043]|uniref:bifunctional lysylphosphatidylglycerol flippase/synthetase MprF n=1 Tax=Tropicimonas sp. IMCC34043 TaxID=2248760 RepID=UPI000E27EDA4|nr:bifunctional lysylphosphatidylglycerol flippase/synthetase MprF [Tropicimonas sp. IMCC34043]
MADVEADETEAPRLRRWLGIFEYPVVRTVVPLALVGLAIFVLHELLREVSWAELRTDLVSARPSAVLASIAYTAVSFAALSLYDVFAVRSVAPGQVPPKVAAAAGAAGYAISNLIGFSYVTGTAIRFRVYSGLGLDVAQIALLLAISWSAFWMGLVLVTGGLLVFHPVGISTVLPIPETVETAVGIAMLAGLAGFFLWLWRGRNVVSILGLRLQAPRIGEALGLTSAAVADLIASSLALYVLMPADLATGFPYFFIVYVAAIALGVLSHAPGGIGVFEATMIAALGAAGRTDVLAALLLYRAIYYGLPFMVATTGLALTEVHLRRHRIGPAARRVYGILRPLVPMLAAALALISGTLLLLSGNLPAVGGRLDVLQDLLPLPLVEVSHLVGSVVGVLLLIVARGLFRRLYRAWLAAMVLLAIGFAASLIKGIDVEEAVAILVAAGLLWLFRGAFYRVEGAAPMRLNLGWFISVVALFAALTWIGFLAYRHVDYRDALWWKVSWSGDASRFLRASLAGSVVLAALALNSLLGARGRVHRPGPIPPEVHRLLADAHDSEANLALLGDKCFLFDPEHRAFLSFADTGASLIAKGDPVGEEAAGRQVLWQFREMADLEGKRPVFYAVSSKYLPTFLDMGLTVLKFGEVARVNLTSFTIDTKKMKDFRQAKNRAKREGLSVEIVPAAEVAAIFPDLKRVSDAWLTHKQGREKSFALGACTKDFLVNFDHAVLRLPPVDGAPGQIVAFANILRGGTDELSVDLMRYDPAGPKYAMDALFAELMLWGQAQGFAWFNLGAAPFAGVETHALASFWHRLGGFAFEHGERLYHFEGLRSFKEKFEPVWSPNYIVSQGGLAVARAFVDVNQLISGGVKGLVQKKKS